MVDWLAIGVYAPQAADTLAEYALFSMQAYLTDVWGVQVTHAAGILNIWGGIRKILPVFLLFFVDVFLGNYTMVVLSSIACSMGLGFISMSTPPVFADATGTCELYEPKCVGYTQRVLFYTGMALVAVGTSGISVSTKRFILEQIVKPDDEHINIKHRLQISHIILAGLCSLTGALALPYIKSWSLRFGIPAICAVVAMLLFLSGGRDYKRKSPVGSSLTAVCRVLVASLHKRSLTLPLDKRSLHYGDESVEEVKNSTRELTETHCLGFLEKAAILVEGSSQEDQAKDKWRLCKVSEVEEAKTVIRMVPLWLTFIVVGFVSSHANTYFVEQATHMNPHVGKWRVPHPMFLLFYNLVKRKYTYLHVGFFKTINMHAPRIVIGLAMIHSVLCCVTAAKIEGTRLKVFSEHKSDNEVVHMSTHWLLFQFFLLAGLDSLFESGVVSLYRNQAPESLEGYLKYISKGVSGLGYMFSVIFVNRIMQINDGSKDWFQTTLNMSRLDKYYWLLAMISSANLAAYIFVACFYWRKESDQKKRMDDGDHVGAGSL